MNKQFFNSTLFYLSIVYGRSYLHLPDTPKIVRRTVLGHKNLVTLFYFPPAPVPKFFVVYGVLVPFCAPIRGSQYIMHLLSSVNSL